jgi:hypothetical protein
MAESMTYGSLIQDVQDYAERADQPFLDQIPRFVMMAENRIASEVRGLGYLKIVSGNLTQGNPVLEKPARWRETAQFYIVVGNKKVNLKKRTPSYLDAYWPDSSLTDVPEYYGDYGYEHIQIVPTPAQAYSLVLKYYERPEPLDSSNQTNWTTQYAPQLLLYGSLLEAQPFLKLSNRIPEFQALFDRASSAVTNEAQRRLQGDESLNATTA